MDHAASALFACRNELRHATAVRCEAVHTKPMDVVVLLGTQGDFGIIA
jgi:hypothetical protein